MIFRERLPGNPDRSSDCRQKGYPKLDEKVKNAILNPNHEESLVSIEDISSGRIWIAVPGSAGRRGRQGRVFDARPLAEREGLSVANAGKLMWILSKAGLVSAQRRDQGRIFAVSAGIRNSVE